MNCLKCGHQWEAKVDQPRRCPNCKSTAYMYPPGVGLAAGRELGIFDLDHADMADEVASVRDALSEGPGSARLGNQASSSAPPADPSLLNTRKRDTRKVKVVSEPKDWSDPTPLETVEEMTLAEAQRRYPHTKISPVKGVVGFNGDPEKKTAYPIEPGEALFILDESKEPDMDELRKIASGEIIPTGYFSKGERGKFAGKLPQVVGVEFVSDEEDQRRQAEIATCPYKELDPEANEWVYCSLPVHDGKTKHAPGRKEGA